MKKIFSIVLFLLLISNVCFASSEYIEAFINKKITIKYGIDVYEDERYNGNRYGDEEYCHASKYTFKNYKFYDVNENEVFPISYQGTTYLPVRAISSLLDIPIEWNEKTNSIYLTQGLKDHGAAKEDYESKNKKTNELMKISMLRNEDIKIYYNGEIQTFKDVNGTRVYPLSYNGTTYLPIRAVSNLFNLFIDWESETQTVLIKEKNNSKIFGDKEIKEDLIFLTDEELEIALNEIFAKYGHDFATQRLEDYFMQKKWYQKVDGKKVSVTDLTKQEQQNINKIQEEIARRKTAYRDINELKQPDVTNIEDYKTAEILKDNDGKYYAKIYDSVEDAINVPLNDSKISNVELLPSKIYMVNDNYKYYYKYEGEIYYIPVEKANSYSEERIVLMEDNIEIYNNGDLVINNTRIPNFFNVEAFDEVNDRYPKHYENIIEFLVSCTPILDAYAENIGFKYNLDNDIETNEYIFTIASSTFEGGAIYISSEEKLLYIDREKKFINIQILDGQNLTKNLDGYMNLFAKGFSSEDMKEGSYLLNYYGSGFCILGEYINQNFVDGYYIFIPNHGFELVNKTLDGKNVDMNKYVFTLKDEVKLYSIEKYIGEYGPREWLEGYVDSSKYDKVWYRVNEVNEGIIETEQVDCDEITLKAGTKVRMLLAEGWWHIIFESEDGKEAYIIHFTPAGVT